jgi:hypothetical protein
LTHPFHRLVSLKTPVLSIHTLPPQEQLEALFSGLFLTEKYSLLRLLLSSPSSSSSTGSVVAALNALVSCDRLGASWGRVRGCVCV